MRDMQLAHLVYIKNKRGILIYENVMLSQKEFNMRSNISALSKLLGNQIRRQQRKVKIELRSGSILSALQKHTA